MTELLTAAQMRAIEQAAIASGKVTGLELMERAGRGVVEAIFEEWPELKAGSFSAVVLCGPGNNGGDGFVVARLLKDWGWEVEVFLYGNPEKLPSDARVNYERWRERGEVGDLDNYGALPVLGNIAALGPRPGYDPVIVDALFGTGSLRSSDGQLGEVLDHVAHIACYERTKVVAVDLPSGICADGGRPIGVTAGAALTVAFHRPKVGHFIGEGPAASGKLCVVDIGLEAVRAQGDEARALSAGWAFAPAPGGRVGREPGLAPRQHLILEVDFVLAGPAAFKHEGHKFTHGHALILSGPPGHTGAARLAARGALRIGTGLVTVGCPPEAVPENAARLDAVMIRKVSGGGDLAGALADPRITSLCLGPGLGLDARAVGLVAAALGLPAGVPPPPAPPHEGEGRHIGQSNAQYGHALPLPLVGRGEGRGAARKTVLDADALTILSRTPNLFAALNQTCILTPHAGEFARLFPDIAEKLAAPAATGPAYSKVDATRDAAKRAGSVVLFKGPDTVIADPSGRCAINSAHYDRAAPWLATAGSGDVLAGFIAGLMARGFGPFDAACTAAWLHVECARKFGPGLIAEDLPEQLPAVFRDLGL